MRTHGNRVNRAVAAACGAGIVLSSLAFAARSVSAAIDGPTRMLRPEIAAWWTFDNHLRDEAHGLQLKNVPNRSKKQEDFYVSIQYIIKVPILQITGKMNYRSYYRWGVPSLTHCTLGDQMDAPGPFTIEAYLMPRSDAKFQKQPRAHLLRKYRVGAAGKLQPQWLIELRRRPDQKRSEGDLWASVTFQTADGRLAAREVLARNAVRMGYWQRMALVYDGTRLSIVMDGKTAASVAGPGAGARLLPSGGKSRVMISNLHHQVDGKPVPRDKRWLTTIYSGTIDELRVTKAALAGDELLPPIQVLSRVPLPEPPKRKEYSSIARRHLDLLMKHGTDVYGPVHSPLLGSTLDPKTLKMVKIKPSILSGMPMPYGPYRSPMWGCNLGFMRNTFMAMRALSAVTGDARYAGHADKALRFWLKTCIYPSGVWPIGEHGVWNFYTDKPQPLRPHEPGAHLNWPLYYEIAPEAVAKGIAPMHRIHCFKSEYEGKTLWFHGRHGSSQGKPKKTGLGFARHSGLLARAWLFMYSKTNDPKYLQWAKDQLETLWQLRDPKSDLVHWWIYPPHKPPMPNDSVIQAALGFVDGAKWLDDPAEKKLFMERGTALGMASYNRIQGWDGKKFTRVRAGFGGSPHMPGGHFLLLKLWERTGRPAHLLAHCCKMADKIIKTARPTKNTSAGTFGWQMMFFVQMYNETGEERYLNFARRLGDYAVANLVADNGLVLGSGYYRLYDRMYHVPKLVQALIALDHPKHPAIQPLLWEPIF